MPSDSTYPVATGWCAATVSLITIILLVFGEEIAENLSVEF